MSAKNTKSEDPGGSGVPAQKIAQARAYFEESKAELKKVTWPTKAEVRVTTLAVLILVVIMALFLGVIDWALVWAVKGISTLGI
ncbi:MAG: preprotein translocase subunit SecE [Deltaproteobacteria bacterium]|jgi:preprotein translocase subunit SecE|nr:preprotein translocase subunit SecE [Deltaproteobacteria bacterium]